MIAAQIFQRIVNAPSPAGVAIASAVAVALLILGCGMLAAGKKRWLGGGLGALGFLTILAALMLVEAQTVQTREGESITVTRPRYSEGARRLARLGLIGLPALAGAVAVALWAAAQRRLRSRVPRQLKAGRKHFFRKEYDSALVEYTKAIQIAPYLAEAYCGRGCVHHAMGDTAQALADLDRAVECDPRMAPAFIERAKLRTEAGDLDGALADFERLMLLRATDPELYLNRGICLLKKGQVKDAVADFHRVLKLTNHSDFAEPAKYYLRQFEVPGEAGAAEAAGTLNPAGNGAPASTAMPQPKAEDYVL
jgi:tetratricopeptide (TPR) repeat protein